MLGSFEGGKPWSWAEIPNWTRPEEVPRHLWTAQVISLVPRVHGWWSLLDWLGSCSRRTESSTGGVFLARSREMPGLLGLDQSTGKAFYLKMDVAHR